MRGFHDQSGFWGFTQGPPRTARAARALLVLAAAVAATGALSSAQATTDIWTNGSGDNLWNTTSKNWNTTTNLYANGDTVQFDDTAGPNNVNVTVAPQTPPLNPAGITVDSSTNNYVFSGGGYIAGSGSLLKDGSSTLTIGNSVANTYTGGTTINDGTLLANNFGTAFIPGGSSTGTGPVLVNGGATSGTLGGDGTVGGGTSIQSGATLAPGSGTAGDMLTFSDSGNSALTLSTGANLSYSLNAPNKVGGTNGNDMATVAGQVVINPNISLSVTPGASFNTGTYQLINYGSLQDNSNNFSGWNASLTSIPANLPASTYYTMGFSNHFTANSSGLNTINLDVTTSTTAPTLGPGQSAALVQPANTPLDKSTPSSPAFTIGGAHPTQFFVARGPDNADNAPKMFNFGWAVAPVLLPVKTVYWNAYNASASVQGVATVNNAGKITGWTFPAARTGPAWAYAGSLPLLFGEDAAGNAALNQGLEDTGTPFAAGNGAGQNENPNNPVADASNYANAVGGAPNLQAAKAGQEVAPKAAWVPAGYLAPFVVVGDPPASEVPTYYGEAYTNPSGDTGIYLADMVNGVLDLPTSLDQLATGADAQSNYSGSFLSLVQSVLSGITSLSQLTDAQWLMFNGSYGVDATNSTAWTVTDAPNNDFAVIGLGTAVGLTNTPEPGAMALMAACGGLLLLARRRRTIG